MKHHLFRIIVGLATTVVYIQGCGERIGTEPVKVERQEVSGVSVSTLSPVEVSDYYDAAGTVRAGVISEISAKVMGRVVSIPVKAGDPVRAGQVLMRLDDSDAVQKIRAAEQALAAAVQNRDLAESTYARYRKLYEGKALSGQEFAEITARKKVAEAEYGRMEAALGEARVYRGYTVVTSPLSGRLTEKKIDPGSMAAPGVPLLTVESGRDFRIEAYVDEVLAGAIQPGTPVDIRIDSIRFSGKGKISEVVPAVDPATRSFLVKVPVSGPGLKSGLYARVRIPLGKKAITAVPVTSVMEKGQLTGVYAISPQGVITYRLVRVGKTFGDQIEILSGIKAGERIITSGLDKAVDGGVLREEKSR